jgi:hypothetical protein
MIFVDRIVECRTNSITIVKHRKDLYPVFIAFYVIMNSSVTVTARRNIVLLFDKRIRFTLKVSENFVVQLVFFLSNYDDLVFFLLFDRFHELHCWSNKENVECMHTGQYTWYVGMCCMLQFNHISLVCIHKCRYDAEVESYLIHW